MNTLGHYTSPRGLLGIISSKKIWATNIKFLNDEQEFTHTLNLIKEIIPKSNIKKENPRYPSYVEFISTLKDELDKLDDYRTESIFTFSASEKLDLLSQWRGYCPNNNGLCLEIDIEKIYQHTLSIFPHTSLEKCVYDTNEKKNRIKKLINEYFKEYSESNNKDDKEAILGELIKKISILASHFKHPSFSEENEWRIIIMTRFATEEERLKFREGNFSLIPYLEIPCPLSAISGIKIGPTSNSELVKRSLKLFLGKTFDTPSETPIISTSKTPYRPW